LLPRNILKLHRRVQHVAFAHSVEQVHLIIPNFLASLPHELRDMVYTQLVLGGGACEDLASEDGSVIEGATGRPNRPPYDYSLFKFSSVPMALNERLIGADFVMEAASKLAELRGFIIAHQDDVESFMSSPMFTVGFLLSGLGQGRRKRRRMFFY
jgi:hypothetical protein